MYTNAQYTTNNQGIQVDINGITSFVPVDPANTDYQNIMAEVAANTLTIATPTV